MTNVFAAAMFVSENNPLSAMLRARGGYIVVPGAKDPKDRQHFIFTQKQARDHLRTLVSKKTICVDTAKDVMAQIRVAKMRPTMQDIAHQIDNFHPFRDPAESVGVDVCTGCGAHANLTFKNAVVLTGSIEMAFHTFWHQVQYGELNARVAAVTLKKLRTEGPRTAIHTADMPMHVQLMVEMSAQIVRGANLVLMTNDGEMLFRTSDGYIGH